MKIGMLWFDNNPKTEFAMKIEQAATYYRDKYGQAPTVCFVHPSMIAPPSNSNGTKEQIKTGGVEIRPASTILPNHFWIGVNGVKAS
jgi:hypothetical protein